VRTWAEKQSKSEYKINTLESNENVAMIHQKEEKETFNLDIRMENISTNKMLMQYHQNI